MKASLVVNNIYVFNKSPLKKDIVLNPQNIAQTLGIYSDYIQDVFLNKKKCVFLSSEIDRNLEEHKTVFLSKIEYFIFPFFSEGKDNKYMLITSSHVEVSSETINDLNNSIYKIVNYSAKNTSLKNEIETIMQSSGYFRTNLDLDTTLRNSGKFKLFGFVESCNELQANKRFNILNDFCSSLPAGTTAYALDETKEVKDASLAYSENYIKSLQTNNFTTIYKNWSMLAMQDACMVMHNPYIKEITYSKQSIFTEVYHKIYVLNLFSFYFLEEINSYSRSKKYKENELFKVFLNYNKYYNIDSVSTKFLPNIINETIRKGMNLDLKYQSTKDKIMQEKEYAMEKSSELTSKILLLIAVLSLSSFIADTSDWITVLKSDNQAIKFKVIKQLLVLLTLSITFFLSYKILKNRFKK